MRKAFAGFLLGAAGMFAAMYSTQAILPELSRDFDVSPSHAGLSISVVVLAVAVGGFAWGPFSDRIGRPRAIRLASLLLVPPTIGVALAPAFEALLALPHASGPVHAGSPDGRRPVRRRGVRAADRRRGRWATTCRRSSPVVSSDGWGSPSQRGGRLARRDRCSRGPAPRRCDLRCAAACRSRTLPRRGGGIAHHLTNLRLLGVSLAAGALFFTFIGTFTYITYRLEKPPFSYSAAAASLVFLLWLTGLHRAGRRACRRQDRVAASGSRHGRPLG